MRFVGGLTLETIRVLAQVSIGAFLALACGGGAGVSEEPSLDTSDSRFRTIDTPEVARPTDLGRRYPEVEEYTSPDGLVEPPFEPCATNADCASGWCVDHMGGKVCTWACVEECPQGWTCLPVTAGGIDPIWLCLSPFSLLCRPCTQSGDCEVQGTTERCLIYEGDAGTAGTFCGAECEVDTDCPAGFSCTDATSTEGTVTRQCAHLDGLCPCGETAAKLGLAATCSVANNWGVCSGQRVCSEAGLSDCSAPLPEPEICDGTDNNCDGTADEALACCQCGDGICHEYCESKESCCTDCESCGDGECACGEGYTTCPVDCCTVCGDSICANYEPCNEGEIGCPECGAMACGNGACEKGENPFNCLADCEKFKCLNGLCEPGEDSENCPADCALSCGNCTCDPGEAYTTCPVDCGFCGDGYCSKCLHPDPMLDEWDPETQTKLCSDCCDPSAICLPEAGVALECGSDGCGSFCGLCEDGLSCTADECVEGFCAYPISSGCLIDQECYLADGSPPGQPCLACLPELTDASWSLRSDGTLCGLNAVCMEGACTCAYESCLDTCCSPGETCSLSTGACCLPQCQGKECGADGCGSTCGECAELEACTDQGECICAAFEEVCDGIDNDCDGSVDEDLGEVSCGAGACAVTVPACLDGQLQPCEPGDPKPGTCNAPPAPCKTTTTGVDDCGNSCSKVGPTHCYTVHPACLDSNPGTLTDAPSCTTPKGKYQCGLTCQQWPNTIGADCTYCVLIYCQQAPGLDWAQFGCNNIPTSATP